MDEKFFSQRLAALRAIKNVSAREMSLAIGQNDSYINRIENGQAYPSMQGFFYICEYLNITPMEFFDNSDCDPFTRRKIMSALKLLDAKQLELVLSLVNALIDAKK